MPNPQVIMETSKGKLTIELFEEQAPVSVQNFLSYVDDEFYDGTIFHRVIDGFMLQGGGFESGMKKKATKPAIKNESTNGLQNKRGTLAMARTSDPDSATSQFFINTIDNAFLDRASAGDGVGYCVFAQVVTGLDVVDQISVVPTGSQSSHKDVPRTDVTILSVRRA